MILHGSRCTEPVNFRGSSPIAQVELITHLRHSWVPHPPVAVPLEDLQGLGAVIYGDIIPKNLGLVLVEYGLTWFNRDYSGET